MHPTPAALVLAVAASTGQAPTPPETAAAPTTEIIDPAFAAIDARIASALAESGTPGAALVVVRDGRVVHARGHGLADVESRRVARADTVWPIASITKVLTAVAAMQLVEEGRLSLDREAASYLEAGFVPDRHDRPILVADLLRHTSGLDELPGRRVARAQDALPLRRFLADHLVQHRAPGTYTSYSSYGMSLAGLLVEQVSGAGYADHVTARIFRPAGMDTARIMVRAGDERGVATPYAIDDGRATRMEYEWYSTPPVASAAASALDMGKLLVALLDGRLVARDTLRAMTTTQATLHPDVPGWGYGFQLDSVNGRGIAEHGGDIGGFAGLLVVAPEERLGLFIVHHGEGTSLRFAVRQALLDQFVPGTATPPVAIAGVDLAPYAGAYRASFQCHTCADPPPVPEFEVAVDGDALRLWGERWLPIGEDLFARADGRARLAFVRDEGGAISALSGGSWRTGERVRAAPAR